MPEKDLKNYFVGTVKSTREINTKNGPRTRTTVFVPAKDVNTYINVITKDQPMHDGKPYEPGEGVRIPGHTTKPNMGLQPGREYVGKDGQTRVGNPTLWTSTKGWERDEYHDQKTRTVEGIVTKLGPSLSDPDTYAMQIEKPMERSYEPGSQTVPAEHAYIKMSKEVYDHLASEINVSDEVKVNAVQTMTHAYARDEEGKPLMRTGSDGKEYHVYNNAKVRPAPALTLTNSKNVELKDSSRSQEIAREQPAAEQEQTKTAARTKAAQR